MAFIGTAVITVVMACALLGALASLRDDEKGLGKEFVEGIHAIGYIFLPVAGIMASAPLLTWLIRTVVEPAYRLVGADPALAPTSIIAVDMGGYLLAHKVASTGGSLAMALLAGTMAGATIVFSIPVGLSMLDKRDHKYMALGVMAGLLAIPCGVFFGSVLTMILEPNVVPPANGVATLDLHLGSILLNLLPLTLLVGTLAVGLRFFPDRMIQGFMAYGKGIGRAIKVVVVCCIIEYFTTEFYGTGVFTWIFGRWNFDPIIANYKQLDAKADAEGFLDLEDVYRALEVAGYIGIMLAGAFPMVYLIKKYLARPMEAVGKKLGLSPVGAAGILAASANILAMFRLVKDMPPKDKVLNIAFAVCAAFTFGDHLAFTANFQKDLLLPVMLGKLGGGICGFLLAYWLCVPKALEMERADKAAEDLARCAAVARETP